VYFGVQGLNMRGGPDNFSQEELPAVAAICRDAGVRAYLTVNTIVFDREADTVSRVLDAAAACTDAVICWDPAVIEQCRARELAFHVSTQASVANAAAARFYRDLGASRIVLARECTLDEIGRIRREAGIDVEVFAHGAMCVSVSGRCFLSLIGEGKSGNRGECSQTCRREFRVAEVDGPGDFLVGDGYILSAKDVCVLPFLENVLAAGPAALKIEGRNRPADYVAVVTGAYRRALDAAGAGALTPELKRKLMAELGTVFNRGFSDGFYAGRPIAEMTGPPGNRASRRKDQVGRVSNYYARPRAAEISVRNHGFRIGDRMLIRGPTTGAVTFTVSEIRREDSPVAEAERGIVTVPVPEKVRRNDEVFRLHPRKETDR
jgi:putative protease